MALLIVALLGWPFALLLAAVCVGEAVRLAEAHRHVTYLTGRLRAYRGSGRGDYELARADDHRGKVAGS